MSSSVGDDPFILPVPPPPPQTPSRHPQPRHKKSHSTSALATIIQPSFSSPSLAALLNQSQQNSSPHRNSSHRRMESASSSGSNGNAGAGGSGADSPRRRQSTSTTNNNIPNTPSSSSSSRHHRRIADQHLSIPPSPSPRRSRHSTAHPDYTPTSSPSGSKSSGPSSSLGVPPVPPLPLPSSVASTSASTSLNSNGLTYSLPQPPQPHLSRSETPRTKSRLSTSHTMVELAGLSHASSSSSSTPSHPPPLPKSTSRLRLDRAGEGDGEDKDMTPKATEKDKVDSGNKIVGGSSNTMVAPNTPGRSGGTPRRDRERERRSRNEVRSLSRGQLISSEDMLDLVGCVRKLASLRTTHKARLSALLAIERIMAESVPSSRVRGGGSPETGMTKVLELIEANAPTILLDLLKRHSSSLLPLLTTTQPLRTRERESVSQVVREMEPLLSILQGLCLLDRWDGTRRKSCGAMMEDEVVLEMLVDLLLTVDVSATILHGPRPSIPIPLHLLRILMLIIIQSPKNASVFDRIGGCASVQSLLLRSKEQRSVQSLPEEDQGFLKTLAEADKELKMHCIEFLLFWDNYVLKKSEILGAMEGKPPKETQQQAQPALNNDLRSVSGASASSGTSSSSRISSSTGTETSVQTPSDSSTFTNVMGTPSRRYSKVSSSPSSKVEDRSRTPHRRSGSTSSVSSSAQEEQRRHSRSSSRSSLYSLNPVVEEEVEGWSGSGNGNQKLVVDGGVGGFGEDLDESMHSTLKGQLPVPTPTATLEPRAELKWNYPQQKSTVEHRKAVPARSTPSTPSRSSSKTNLAATATPSSTASAATPSKTNSMPRPRHSLSQSMLPSGAGIFSGLSKAGIGMGLPGGIVRKPSERKPDSGVTMSVSGNESQGGQGTIKKVNGGERQMLGKSQVQVATPQRPRGMIKSSTSQGLSSNVDGRK